jgi:Pretoxin HINT domain
VVAGAETITATDHHPFFVTEDGGHWVNAGELHEGQHLRAADGTTRTITHLTKRSQHVRVYNLTINAVHTYYVGPDPILVHNAGGCESLVGGGAEPPGKYGPFYRKEPIAENRAAIADSGELLGNPPRYAPDRPAVQAHTQPLSERTPQIEFYTDVAPDPAVHTPPGQAMWSGPRPGVEVANDKATICVVVTGTIGC